MKITKYPQSCLRVEEDGRTLLVDVGTLATGEYGINDFGPFDAVLFTHSHGDHFDVEFLPKLAATGATLYGNADVAAKAGSTPVEVIDESEELVVAGFKVRAYQMEHCLMTTGQPAGVPNTGFLINDYLLLPGDSTEDVGITADAIALPVFGPDISMKDAYGLALATKAQKILPVHYDVVGMKPEAYGRFVQATGAATKAEIIALENGNSAEF